MTDAQLLTLTLGLAITGDTYHEYGRLCWQLQRGAVLWPGDSDQLYAVEWWSARVREIDSEALARQSLAMEDYEIPLTPAQLEEPCFDCGRMDCDGLCTVKPDPPYCVLCGGECERDHSDDETQP